MLSIDPADEDDDDLKIVNPAASQPVQNAVSGEGAVNNAAAAEGSTQQQQQNSIDPVKNPVINMNAVPATSPTAKVNIDSFCCYPSVLHSSSGLNVQI